MYINWRKESTWVCFWAITIKKLRARV